MRPSTRPCGTCPHTHPDHPLVVNFPEVWAAIRAADPDDVPCHESFPEGWDGDESVLRACAGVRQ